SGPSAWRWYASTRRRSRTRRSAAWRTSRASSWATRYVRLCRAAHCCKPCLARRKLKGRFLGPYTYSESKDKGDSNMCGPRQESESDVGLAATRTRETWRRLHCLKSSSQTEFTSPIGRSLATRCHPVTRIVLTSLTPLTDGALTKEVRKGDERMPTS